MAMRSSVLLSHVFPYVKFDPDEVDETPFIARLRMVGQLLFDADVRWTSKCSYVSDTVRGWLAMATVCDNAATTTQLVAQLDPFITDHHFAVREWAWLSIRPAIVARLDVWLEGLVPLVRDENPLRRRFAIEATRPRSVWGQHIAQLKATPDLMSEPLANLRCDDDRYVQDSVSNWLNDAARTRPDWVRQTTDEWIRGCSCKNTARIVKRAVRSLDVPRAE